MTSATPAPKCWSDWRPALSKVEGGCRSTAPTSMAWSRSSPTGRRCGWRRNAEESGDFWVSLHVSMLPGLTGSIPTSAYTYVR